MKEIMPNVEMVHYMTDSPTTQYSNKQIFSMAAQHDTIFHGIRASWLYFEAEHRNGPCDGVGGTSKRLADMAVKRHSAIIQSADDIYQWGKSQENSSLKYIFVLNSRCTEVREKLSNIFGKPVKGTIQMHVVIPLGGGGIAVRDASCFCKACFVDGKVVPACEGWTIHNMSSDQGTDVEIPFNSNSITDELERTVNELSDASQLYNVNAYVAAIYESKWYIGQILE